jgi:hypothetical protein
MDELWKYPKESRDYFHNIGDASLVLKRTTGGRISISSIFSE